MFLNNFCHERVVAFNMYVFFKCAERASRARIGTSSYSLSYLKLDLKLKWSVQHARENFFHTNCSRKTSVILCKSNCNCFRTFSSLYNMLPHLAARAVICETNLYCNRLNVKSQNWKMLPVSVSRPNIWGQHFPCNLSHSTDTLQVLQKLRDAYYHPRSNMLHYATCCRNLHA